MRKLRAMTIKKKTQPNNFFNSFFLWHECKTSNDKYKKPKFYNGNPLHILYFIKNGTYYLRKYIL